MTDKKDMSMSAKVDAAFRQAASKAIQIAKQTNTPVILWKDGHVVEVPPDQFEPEKWEEESGK